MTYVNFFLEVRQSLQKLLTLGYLLNIGSTDVSTEIRGLLSEHIAVHPNDLTLLINK